MEFIFQKKEKLKIEAISKHQQGAICMFGDI